MSTEEELHERLQRLHGELGQAEVTDDASRAKIQNLQSGIQTVLDPSIETQPHHYHSLREQLKDAVEHFEDSHAELTLSIGEVLNDLAAIGL